MRFIRKSFLKFSVPLCLCCEIFLFPFFVACSRSSNRAPYPHESALSIIAELKIGLRSDPYKDEPARDLEGANLYRVTLARLDSLNELLSKSKPGEYDDVIAFARGECHERLGSWGDAELEFGRAARAGTSLTEAAETRKNWSRRFADATSPTTGSLTLEGFVNALDLRRIDLEKMRGENPPFPYGSFARVEMESALEAKATFLFSNRLILPRGVESALEAAKSLVEENRESRKRGQNQLLLGEIYETLARDYARLFPPEQGKFDSAPWSQWMESARTAYREASQADGDPAKPEGEARLRALDAYAQRIADAAR